MLFFYVDDSPSGGSPLCGGDTVLPGVSLLAAPLVAGRSTRRVVDGGGSGSDLVRAFAGTSSGITAFSVGCVLLLSRASRSHGTDAAAESAALSSESWLRWA